MAARTCLFSGFAAFAVFAAGGCLGIYGDISDLEDSTVIHESSRPDDVASEDYAIQTIFGGSGADGVKVTVLGRSPAGVVNLRFDRSGGLDSSGVQLGSDFNDINASVPVASFPARFDANDSIALGLPLANGGARIALFDADASQIDTKQFRLNDIPTGVSIGISNVSLDTDLDQPDLVAVAAQTLTMFANYPAANPQPAVENTFTCTMPEAAINVFSGDVFGQAVDGDEVAVAIGGTVRVIDGATIEAQSTAMADCFVAGVRAEITAPMGELDFGSQILVADLDDSGSNELIVTAPSAGRVYVFFDIAEGAVPAPVMLQNEGGFGTAIAVGDLDADGIVELAVGAPSATVDGVVGAGQVHVFNGEPGALPAAIDPPLALADSESNGAFGRALTVGKFDDVDDLLVVGAQNKLFVYFQHPLGNDEDPRVP